MDADLIRVFLVGFEKEDGRLCFEGWYEALEVQAPFCAYYITDDEGYECDAWRKYTTEPQKIFRNQHNQTLVVREDLQESYAAAAFETLTTKEAKSGNRVHFTLHRFRDTVPKEGLPVAFSIQVNRKTYTMYCEKDQQEVRFREGEVPDDIPGDTSDIIFNQRNFESSNQQAFRFESALMRGFFLAFKVAENTPSELILKKPKDEPDESTKIIPF